MWHPFHTIKGDGAPEASRKHKERFRDVATESELFLGGRYADHLISRGLPIPDWAWLNVLAHSPAHVIAAVANREPGIPARWCHRNCDQARVDEVTAGQTAVRYLARELLRRARDGGRRIEDIQREVLVDLELQLAHKAEVAGCLPTGTLTPAQLIMKVLSTLDNPLNHRA